MTTQEFSIEFDILYNNLASNTAPPLNEYEKSVFLTKAQSDIVIELYSGRNNLGLSYESSEEVRNYLKGLLIKKENTFGYSQQSYIELAFPSDIMFITREELDGVPVIPISQDEYNRIKNNPFKGPSLRRALRIVQSNSKIILWFKSPSTKDHTYIAYGISRPYPIILDGIDDPTLTIEGMTTDTPRECILDASLHRMILDRAVLYAKQAYIGGQLQE